MTTEFICMIFSYHVLVAESWDGAFVYYSVDSLAFEEPSGSWAGRQDYGYKGN